MFCILVNLNHRIQRHVGGGADVPQNENSLFNSKNKSASFSELYGQLVNHLGRMLDQISVNFDVLPASARRMSQGTFSTVSMTESKFLENVQKIHFDSKTNRQFC
jgi:hypothetical protein